jgi:hypothetical protein
LINEIVRRAYNHERGSYEETITMHNLTVSARVYQ